MSRRSRAFGEDGAGVVLVLALVALLTFLALVASSVSAVVVGHRRVQAAADLAALAGATARENGEDPCVAAADQARLNGASSTDCVVDGGTVRVVVELSLPAGLGGRTVVARARAGPVSR
ncbi:MAG: hypothetical protein JWQ74_50 [Marmoricola sp.]|nr:hypothetical protein [Marmoricola sp.]